MPTPKKSASLHAVEGTAPKKAPPARKPLPAVTDFDPPAHLREVAAAEWKRLAPSMAQTGRLTVGDLRVFEVYCQSVERARECDAAIGREGMIQALNNGAVGPHPLVRIGEKAQKTMLDCADRLGLTPINRGKVSGSGGDEDAKDDGSVGALGAKPPGAV